MIDRKNIEQILRLNGLSQTAPDEEIRSVLISARWNKEDVDTAITVLRENTKTHASRVDKLHDVFFADKALSPEAIHSLLGIDVEVNASEMDNLRARRRSAYRWQVVSIFVFSIIIAAAFLIGMMYWQQAGPFHPSL
jgi:hypothetical protein